MRCRLLGQRGSKSHECRCRSAWGADEAGGTGMMMMMVVVVEAVVMIVMMMILTTIIIIVTIMIMAAIEHTAHHITAITQQALTSMQPAALHRR
jgi:hypothetical protein